MLAELLSETRVLHGLEPSDKTALLRQVAEAFAADDSSLSAKEVYAALYDRERLASTGAGSGVAIPHGRLAAVTDLRAVLAIVPAGVDFEAIDGDPVTLVVAILAPRSAPSEHLKALARTGRALRDAAIRKALLSTSRASEALDVLRSVPSS